MSQIKSVAFITLGCKVNTSETEGMRRLFEKAGYAVVNEEGFADVYIVNTCTVTNMGDRKSRHMLRKAHAANPNAVIAAVGCFAQVSPEEAGKIEGVSLVVGNNHKHEIVELVEKARESSGAIYVEKRDALDFYEELPVESYIGHTRAFIKIQDGCDQFCSYCIIPYARGPIRSRGFDAVLQEARNAASKGYKEVVLTGIHLTSFGDRAAGTDLMTLVDAVSRIDGIERIRLGSLEPMFINSEFIKKAKEIKKLCPHFHISLQSGSAETLKRMNRKYTPDDFRMIMASLKQEIPDVAVTTDIMVGFPGETDEAFEESYAFCMEMGFMWTHVFKYSPRKGTPAAKFKNQVSPMEKEARSRRMIALSEKSRNAYYSRFVGRQLKVLFEIPAPDVTDYIEGHTPNYLPVAVGFDRSKIGEIWRVRIDEILGERLKGSIIKD